MECEAMLDVGAEVSARFRGAYCEAIVKRVVSGDADVRVQFLKPLKSSHVISGKCIKGRFRVNQPCNAKHPQDGHYYPAIVQSVVDRSIYLVEFDDGDVKQLRRNQIKPKSQPHFVNAPTIMNLPLTNPEKAHVDGSPPDHSNNNTPTRSRHGRSNSMGSASPASEMKTHCLEPYIPVFIEPVDSNAASTKEFWRIAMEVPDDDRDSSIGMTATHGHTVVRFFDDLSFSVVPIVCLRRFARNVPLYRLFSKQSPGFLLDLGVTRALAYLDNRRLPAAFAWPGLKKWARQQSLSWTSTSRRTSEASDNSSVSNGPGKRRNSVASESSLSDVKPGHAIRSAIRGGESRRHSISSDADRRSSGVSVNGGEMKETQNIEGSPTVWRYKVGDVVWAMSYMDGATYEAKVVKRQLRSTARDSRRAATTVRSAPTPHYLMRYKGWEDKYSEWIHEDQLFDENPFQSKPRRRSNAASAVSLGAANSFEDGQSAMQDTEHTLLAEVKVEIEPTKTEIVNKGKKAVKKENELVGVDEVRSTVSASSEAEETVLATSQSNLDSSKQNPRKGNPENNALYDAGNESSEENRATINCSTIDQELRISKINVSSKPLEQQAENNSSGGDIADHVSDGRSLVEDVKTSARSVTNHVLNGLASGLGLAEIEHRMRELKAEYAKHRDALARIDRKKRAKLAVMTNGLRASTATVSSAE